VPNEDELWQKKKKRQFAERERLTGCRAEWHLEFIASAVVVPTNLFRTRRHGKSMESGDFWWVEVVQSCIDVPVVEPVVVRMCVSSSYLVRRILLIPAIEPREALGFVLVADDRFVECLVVRMLQLRAVETPSDVRVRRNAVSDQLDLGL
jgi:hypothetical protein